MFSDAIGAWCPWHVSKQELQIRLEEQWQRAVAASLRHRPGFAGLQHADVLLTRHLLRQQAPEAQAVLRVALTGRFFTEKELHHIGQAETPTCPFCGADDSVAHRVEQCPEFRQERDLHLASLQCELATLQPAQREHAWAVCPVGLDELRDSLNAIPGGNEGGVRPIPGTGQRQHLFIDGSCLTPTIPQLRIASWSVVLACSTTLFASEILAAGQLPTILQTSYRAEIYAALVALQFVDSSDGPFCIWSDCAGVVARLQQ